VVSCIAATPTPIGALVGDLSEAKSQPISCRESKETGAFTSSRIAKSGARPYEKRSEAAGRPGRGKEGGGGGGHRPRSCPGSSQGKSSSSAAAPSARILIMDGVDDMDLDTARLSDYLGSVFKGSLLARLYDTMVSQDVDFDALLLCDDKDLDELGLLKGSRVKILRTIAAWDAAHPCGDIGVTQGGGLVTHPDLCPQVPACVGPHIDPSGMSTDEAWLRELGFTSDAARRGLAHSADGSVQGALEWLVGRGGGDSAEGAPPALAEPEALPPPPQRSNAQGLTDAAEDAPDRGGRAAAMRTSAEDEARALLEPRGEGGLTGAVIAAFTEAGFESTDWVDELKDMVATGQIVRACHVTRLPAHPLRRPSWVGHLYG
jgi:hypothetical protein